MDRVAAKIAQKVGVLFKNRNSESDAREEYSQHQAGRATSCDTNLIATLHDVSLSVVGALSQLRFEAGFILRRRSQRQPQSAGFFVGGAC
jgi:hypothetical protein